MPPKTQTLPLIGTSAITGKTKRNNLVLKCSNASKDAYGMTNSIDPDLNAPKRSILIWVCTVCSKLSVPILGIFYIISSNKNARQKSYQPYYETTPASIKLFKLTNLIKQHNTAQHQYLLIAFCQILKL